VSAFTDLLSTDAVQLASLAVTHVYALLWRAGLLVTNPIP
jgi:hypothetical protein